MHRSILYASGAVTLTACVLLVILIRTRTRRRTLPPSSEASDISNPTPRAPSLRPVTREMPVVDVQVQKNFSIRGSRITFSWKDPDRFVRLWFVWNPQRLTFKFPMLVTASTETNVHEGTVDETFVSWHDNAHRQVLVLEPNFYDTVRRVDIAIDTDTEPILGYLFYSFFLYVRSDGKVGRLGMPPFIQEI